jgi:hypothetical protein
VSDFFYPVPHPQHPALGVAMLEPTLPNAHVAPPAQKWERLGEGMPWNAPPEDWAANSLRLGQVPYPEGLTDVPDSPVCGSCGLRRVVRMHTPAYWGMDM